jgi:hypothetical protein
MTRWWPRRRASRHAGGGRPRYGDLDIAMPAPHDMSDAGQAQARARIESLVSRLQPRAIDAGSREVLNNLINAWMDQASARVNHHHIEQAAVSAALIGRAREEVARRRPQYEADYSRAQHAGRTLAVTYQQLTGREMTDLPSPHPVHVDDTLVASTLGATSWTDLAGPHGPVAGDRPGGLDPDGWRALDPFLADLLPVPQPRDGLGRPAHHGTAVGQVFGAGEAE